MIEIARKKGKEMVVTITEPNGGETLKSPSEMTVKWTVANKRDGAMVRSACGARARTS